MRRVLNVFKITSKLNKKYYFIVYVQAIIRTGKVLTTIYGLKVIIEGLVNRDLLTTLYYALGILLIEFILGILEKRLLTSHDYHREILKQSLYQELSSKMMNIEYYHLEDPEYLDLAEKAVFSIEHFGALGEFFDSLCQVVYQAVLVFTLFTILISFDAIVVGIILATIFLHFIANFFQSKKRVKLVNKLGPVNRKYNYYDNLMQDPLVAKDFRLFPFSNLIFNKYSKFLNETETRFGNYYVKQLPFLISFIVISALQVSLVYMYIGYKVITLSLGVAKFVYLSTSARKSADSLSGFFDHFFIVSRNAQMLEPLVTLFNMPSSEIKYKDGLIPTELEEIRFENVTFKYPNSKETVLKDVSFTIKKGEKTSIVGINGAGKTTLIKLLCRLYTPTSGAIYWNNKEINEYKYSMYLEQIAAVFQDFKIFALTIKENIDINNKNTCDIENCLNKVSMSKKIKNLQDGMNTYVSKEYHKNGTELSGGELQKVAIARAMIKDSSLIILDEPTSALDPLAEAEIYENFANLIKEKTAIFISHRMSSSVFCDKIIVLNEKSVQDIDSHKNLMKKKDSKYYHLFSAQADYYQL